VTDSDKARKFW